MTNGVPTAQPASLRLLESASASALAGLYATFEDLQTVLRCCERLMSETTAGGEARDDIVVEAVWTIALLSYARCFQADDAGTALTEDDFTLTSLPGDAREWHRVLTQLRDHYASPRANPRERFSVGVAQGPDGTADGIGVTSVRQPLVDALTVRQTGAIAFALSGLVNQRITDLQTAVLDDVKAMPKTELEKLASVELDSSG
jgi:hypothetical protein